MASMVRARETRGHNKEKDLEMDNLSALRKVPCQAELETRPC